MAEPTLKQLRHTFFSSIQYDHAKAEEHRRQLSNELDAKTYDKKRDGHLVVVWSDDSRQATHGYTEEFIREACATLGCRHVVAILDMNFSPHRQSRVSVSRTERGGWVYSPMTDQWYRAEDPLSKHYSFFSDVNYDIMCLFTQAYIHSRELRSQEC
jgi:hypothetical protein